MKLNLKNILKEEVKISDVVKNLEKYPLSQQSHIKDSIIAAFMGVLSGIGKEAIIKPTIDKAIKNALSLGLTYDEE